MKSRPHPLGRKIIGAYQLIAGGFGALFFAVQIVRAGGASLGGLVFVAMYALVACAGVALWRGRPRGVPLTLLAQALQVVRISSRSFAYTFVAGLAYWVEVGTSGLRMPGLSFGDIFHWSSGFGPQRESTPLAVGINLVAAGILAYFLYGRSGRKTRR